MTVEGELVRGPSTALGLTTAHGQHFSPRFAQDDGFLKAAYAAPAQGLRRLPRTFSI